MDSTNTKISKLNIIPSVDFLMPPSTKQPKSVNYSLSSQTISHHASVSNFLKTMNSTPHNPNRNLKTSMRNLPNLSLKAPSKFLATNKGKSTIFKPFDYETFCNLNFDRRVKRILNDDDARNKRRQAFEKILDKKAHLHVKAVHDHIVKDFMSRKVRENAHVLASINDTKINNCIDTIIKAANQDDHAIISPFYLTYNSSGLRQSKMKMTQTTINTQFPLFSKDKCKTLFADFMRKQWKNRPQPKNAQNEMLTTEKLTKIKSRYRILLKDARSIQRFSKRKCNRFKKEWTMCEKILAAEKKNLNSIEDPEINFDFYIWQASKLCENPFDKESISENNF